MNYRPYPDVDRARAQLDRGRAPEPAGICTLRVDTTALEAAFHPFRKAAARIRARQAEQPPMAAWIDEHLGDQLQLTDWQRAFVSAIAGITPKHTGRLAIAAAIAGQAVKAGEHVHLADPDGVRCAGGDNACSVRRNKPQCSAGEGMMPS